MLRLASAALTAALILTSPAVAKGQTVPCTVNPDPVVLVADATYTVTATGATPGTLYEVVVQQKGHHMQDESGTRRREFADESGVMTAVVPADDGRVAPESPWALWPGDASVKVKRYRAGGGDTETGPVLLTTCSFTVAG